MTKDEANETLAVYAASRSTWEGRHNIPQVVNLDGRYEIVLYNDKVSQRTLAEEYGRHETVQEAYDAYMRDPAFSCLNDNDTADNIDEE